MADVRVRGARAEDADVIVGMARALALAVGDPPPILDAQSLLKWAIGQDRWGDCLVAQGEAGLLGYVLFCRRFEAHTAERRLWIADLFVSPEARAAGVGQRLMQEVARRAVAQSCEGLCWDVWRENRSGEAFYRKLGAEAAIDVSPYQLTGEALATLADTLEN
jgi:GNAT superfamily N-acetyltransferase